MTGIDLADSVIYGHLWATEETRELLGDDGRTRAWVRIVATLAAVQGELGIIPPAAAEELARLDGAGLDLHAVGEETRASGHSTLGLIRVLRRDLGPEAAEWIYYGATVQDITDTWFGLVMQRVLAIAARELRAIEAALLEHARRHRDTLMLGRTHGSRGCRSRSASRPRCGPPRCGGTSSASSRPSRDSRSVSSRARSGRCRRGASTARSCSGGCWAGSGSACPTPAGSSRATGSRSTSGCWR